MQDNVWGSLGKKKKIDLFKTGYGNEKKDSRRGISRSEKNEILAKQGNNCSKCGNKLDPRATQFDHIKPYAKGGKTEIKNIRALCSNCHSIITNKSRVKQHRKKKAKKTFDFWS